MFAIRNRTCLPFGRQKLLTLRKTGTTYPLEDMNCLPFGRQELLTLRKTRTAYPSEDKIPYHSEALVLSHVLLVGPYYLYFGFCGWFYFVCLRCVSLVPIFRLFDLVINLFTKYIILLKYSVI